MEAVLRGLPHNVTTEMDLQLWALAQQSARTRRRPPSWAPPTSTSAPSPRATTPATCPRSSRTGSPRSCAATATGPSPRSTSACPAGPTTPTHVLGVLANYLRSTTGTGTRTPHPTPSSPPASGWRSRRSRDVVARVGRRSRWRARAVGFALGRVRALVGLRETPKYHLVRLIALARAELAAVGVELAAQGLLDAPDDVFFLDLREVRAAVAGTDQRARVAARREEYARELRRRHVPRVLLSDGTEPEALRPGRRPGRRRAGRHPRLGRHGHGAARVILDPVGARLEPGEILVAPSTDPGWTPLFLTAGGLVMEMGGANSHGAVVAREYGIPAVVGVPDATTRITTGPG